ncbi:MAG: hypothetical protein PHC88_10840 [Terrimicrobiaceae bacterium]|nr:hypothetical protein [Terrimicrobiaceae bacterium]
MSVNGCASTLAQAGKSLSIEWQETKIQWRDAKAQEFERQYLDALPVLIAKSMEAIDDLDRFLEKVRCDCE